MHDAPNRYTLIDEPCYRVGIIGGRQDKGAACLRLFQSLRRNASVSRHDEAGNTLSNTGENRLCTAVTDKNNVIFLDELVNRLNTAGGNTDLPLDCLALFSRDEHITVRRTDNIAIADTHIREIRHAELLEIAFCQIADGNNADKNPLAVRHGDGTQIVLTQYLAEVAQGVMLTNDDLAVHRNVLDTGIEIGNEERLFHMEILQGKLRLLIHLTGACSNSIDAHRLFQMRLSDCGTDGVCVRIAVPDDIDRLCNVQDDTSLLRLPHAAYFDFHYTILMDMIQFLKK